MRVLPFAVGTAVVVVGFLLRGPVFPGRSEDPVRVEVLNGSGVHRAGQGLADELRERGYDVVDIRNADRHDYEETLVLDRVGDPEVARGLAEVLGVIDVMPQRNEGLLLEVTVILGRDLADRYGEAAK